MVTPLLIRFQKKINAFIDPQQFENFLYEYDEPAQLRLVDIFSDVLPDATAFSIISDIAMLFQSIIQEAAGRKRNKPRSSSIPVIMDSNGPAPDLGEFSPENILYLEQITPRDGKSRNPFKVYLDKAKAYYSTKKTLLYAEEPRQFYDLYVCNGILSKRVIHNQNHPLSNAKIISNATISKLEAASKHIIIEGTGGIGKSMFMTHLFLSSSEDREKTAAIPVFIPLRTYKNTMKNLQEFILESLQEFDPGIKIDYVTGALRANELTLLLDGLDEIPASDRDTFNRVWIPL